MAETRGLNEHHSRQKKRHQEMVKYESSVERLITAVRIAAKATVNPELAKTLNEAADWMEAQNG